MKNVIPDNSEEMQMKRLRALRILAVNEAVRELLNEQRAEIITRAKAKLTAQGLSPEQADPTELLP